MSRSRQTALAFIDAFTTLSPQVFLDLRTPTSVHRFAPASLSMPETLSREAFAEHIKGLRKVLSKFPVTPKQIWENEAGRHVTMWCTGEATFHTEVKDNGLSEEEWTYQGEYIFIFEMDESGEKVESVVEFLDSKETEKLRGLMARARRNLGNKEPSH